MIPTARPASSTIAPVPDVDLKPTAEMALNAKRGLELRRKHGKGGTAVGVARARDLARRANLSPDTVRRMHSFFSRHEGNQAGGEDDAGYIAWLLWGGDAGKGWAERKTKELDKETAMRSDTYKAIASRLGMASRPGAKARFAGDRYDDLERASQRINKMLPSLAAKLRAGGLRVTGVHSHDLDTDADIAVTLPNGKEASLQIAEDGWSVNVTGMDKQGEYFKEVAQGSLAQIDAGVAKLISLAKSRTARP